LGYVGKDIIHEGCGLPLEPGRVWDEMPYSVRKGINKAERNNVEVKEVKGTPEDIKVLIDMWYDPEDPNMPTRLTEKEFMFIAYVEGKPIGATILLPVGNHLFLNNLAGSPEGKKLHIQDFLLWHCVKHFESSRFKYIDVGVSYRPSLYKFFKKWKIEYYPIIFNAPEIKVTINDYPFTPTLYKRDYELKNWEKGYEVLGKMTGREEMTFVPSPEYARNICGEEGIDATLLFPKLPEGKLCYVDFSRIYNVQFGTVIFGKEVTDQEMWNNYGCLDVFKRQFILSVIRDEAETIADIIKQRKENYDTLANYFGFEDIEPETKYHNGDNILAYYYFKHERNDRYHTVLENFDIKHRYIEEEQVIGLPVHQNLTKYMLEYIYGTFRGVLNLCSEWTHTDVYGEFKD
jgi:hypothetical protein